MEQTSLTIWLQFSAIMVSVIFGTGGIIGVLNYVKGKKAERADILFKMHQRFIENKHYFDIRCKLENNDKKLYAAVEHEIKKSKQTEKIDKKSELALLGCFDDYLEFFLLVANLWKLGTFNIKVIEGIFGYYLYQIKNNEAIMAYISTPQFRLTPLKELLEKLKH
jgi:hypothetical protein